MIRKASNFWSYKKLFLYNKVEIWGAEFLRVYLLSCKCITKLSMYTIYSHMPPPHTRRTKYTRTTRKLVNNMVEEEIQGPYFHPQTTNGYTNNHSHWEGSNSSYSLVLEMYIHFSHTLIEWRICKYCKRIQYYYLSQCRLSSKTSG